MITKKYDEIISIGCDCTVARYAREMGIRTESYPFDWVISNNTTNLVKCIMEDFKDFTDVKFERIPRYGKRRYYHNKYNMVFLHHSKLQLHVFEQKMIKRIANFKNSLDNNRSILLLRKLHGKKECDDPNRTTHDEDLEQEYLFKNYISDNYNNVDIKMLPNCRRCMGDDIDYDKLNVENFMKNSMTNEN